MAERIFFDDVIEHVWRKGHIDQEFNPEEWLRDDFNNLMCRIAYGDIASPFGWQIDHIVPVALGGANELSNLRPLWWPATQEEDD